MVYNYSVHVEHKRDEANSASSDVAGFAAFASQTETFRLLMEQDVCLSLSAANASRN
jgi:hypothetical protein